MNKKIKNTDPYANINFLERRALIKDKNGKIKFDEIVEFPDYFSDSSVNITASKYLCNEAKHKETSIKQMINRVSDTITEWGNKDGYFVGTEEGAPNEELDNFNYKLKYYQVHQYFAFNSPVYFNCGLQDKPTCSACFILEIDDDMESIADTNKLEHFIFKWGAGSGMNMSRLRSTKERVRGGGFACLTGDTKLINEYRLNKRGLKEGIISIKDLYIRKCKKKQLPQSIRCMIDDGLIGTNEMVDIVNNGVRSIFLLETKNGYKIKATSNHRFLSENDDWKRLDQFKKGEYIAVNGKKREFGECKRCGKKRLLRGIRSKHCGFCDSCAPNRHRTIMGTNEYDKMIKKRSLEQSKRLSTEEYKKYYRDMNLGEKNPAWKGNNVNPKQARDRSRSHYPELRNVNVCERCGHDGRIEIHHIDEDIYNLNRTNLEALCSKCHQSEHVRRRAKFIPHLQKEIDFDEIINIQYIGEEEVYDIQMKDPFNNFIANGFVSHNSGPVSFMKTADVSAGVIKSGGTLRRSAKLVCLDIDHPDIEKFIHCKELEEKKLKILRDSGIEPEEGYEMSDHVFFQNTNISVRISDKFMMSIEQDDDWWTKYVLTGERCEKFSAKKLLMDISEAAWKIADPGVQFSDNINKWNTCLNSGIIESTNPCGELTWLGNSSCNLASLNLLKFFNINEKTGEIKFDIDTFRDVVATVITAQDIMVDNAFYPSRKIINNTHNFRPLGLGYSNLGAALSWLGLPYDSDEGRNIAALLTALLTGYAFEQSNKLAETVGSFVKFEENKEPYYNVLKLHKEYTHQLIGHVARAFSQREDVVGQLANKVKDIAHMLENFVDKEASFRNAQVTLLAPTGTTSFMMGCGTNGVEPGYSLISYKTLSGNDGATIKMVNSIVPQVLKNLGYSEKEIEALCNELHSIEHFEKSEILKEEHLPIFDTSVAPNGGNRCIDYMGHVKMLAAVQPFLSGAISKTINMPKTATAEEIYELYLKSWKMGLKGITVYRDGSKEYQPLNATKKEETQVIDTRAPYKINMPANRPGEIHKFSIGSTEGYLMTGLLENGQLGEVFLTVAKQGSTLSGLLDSLAIMISISLQYGVPLKSIVKKLMFTRFDPSGITSNSDVRFATSIVDYLGRYLGNKYLSNEDKIELGLKKFEDEDEEIGTTEEITIVNSIPSDSGSSPICDCCGGIMQRVGTCFNCNNCGANSGACG